MQRIGGNAVQTDTLLDELPDSRPWFAHHFSKWQSQLAICLLMGLVLRATIFGDPAVHVDEDFYFLVGQRMHLGLLPYVDMWDRKPLGLFLLYYLFAGISHSVLSYQIAAWLSAGYTAFVVTRIASRWTEPQGAVLAGLVYLALLNGFEGIGGQSPVFYNAFTASAAWCVVSAIPALRAGRIPTRVYGAMALLGLAITIKQTVFFESVFFGLFTVYLLAGSKSPLPWLRIALFVTLGAAPFLAIAAFYYRDGYWFAFWYAMITANLDKAPVPLFAYVVRFVQILLRAWPAAIVVVIAFRKSLRSDPASEYRPFLAWWMVAALVGFISVPNLYVHYCLPVALPAAIIMASELNRRVLGLFYALVIFAMAITVSNTFDRARSTANIRDMKELATAIRTHSPNNTLFVFDAPPLLYTLSGAQPLSRLLLPNHFTEAAERNTSYLNTAAEIRRVIAHRPGAVAMSTKPRPPFYNHDSYRVVNAYVEHHCRPVASSHTYEMYRDDTIIIYGDCR